MVTKAPTMRLTREACIRNDWLYETTERWVSVRGPDQCKACGSYEIPNAGYRKDLFGFVDAIAIRPEGFIFLQVTTSGSLANRVRKIREGCEEFAWAVLQAGGEIQVWGWRQTGRKERRVWWARRREIYMGPSRLETRDLEDI